MYQHLQMYTEMSGVVHPLLKIREAHCVKSSKFLLILSSERQSTNMEEEGLVMSCIHVTYCSQLANEKFPYV